MTRKRNAATFCVPFKDIVQGGIAVNVESEPSSYSASILADKASKSGIKFTCAVRWPNLSRLKNQNLEI